MKTLLVTADDLGTSRETNAAIARAASEGIVTQASLLANGPWVEDAIDRLDRIDRLGGAIPIGVHLNLTEGAAMTGVVPGATDRHGRFLGMRRVLIAARLGRLDLERAGEEFVAQITAVVAAGVRPSHVDGHHHVHVFRGLFDRVCSIARAHEVGAVRVPFENAFTSHPGARVKRWLLTRLAAGVGEAARGHGLATADHFRGLSLLGVGRDHHERLRRLLAALPPGTTELMVHPREGTLGEVEVQSLIASETRSDLDRLGVRLGSYRDL